ncbi:hypothetical protein AAMO2058_001472400 [Amorphochlora amoebiformis]
MSGNSKLILTLRKSAMTELIRCCQRISDELTKHERSEDVDACIAVSSIGPHYSLMLLKHSYWSAAIKYILDTKEIIWNISNSSYLVKPWNIPNLGPQSIPKPKEHIHKYIPTCMQPITVTGDERLENHKFRRHVTELTIADISKQAQKQ